MPESKVYLQTNWVLKKVVGNVWNSWVIIIIKFKCQKQTLV